MHEILVAREPDLGRNELAGLATLLLALCLCDVSPQALSRPLKCCPVQG